MIVRDFNFASWAIEQGISHQVSHGKCHLHVDTQTLERLLTEYRSTAHSRLSNRAKKIATEVNLTRNINA